MKRDEGQYWDVSWSPVRGCTKVSRGCENCWAERMAKRFALVKGGTGPGNQWLDPGPFYGFADKNGWTGRVELIEAELVKPLHWRKPRVVALNWMGDLFHGALKTEDIFRVFATMAVCPQHRFLVLTKRSARMKREVAGACSTAWVEGLWRANGKKPGA